MTKHKRRVEQRLCRTGTRPASPSDVARSDGSTNNQGVGVEGAGPQQSTGPVMGRVSVSDRPFASERRAVSETMPRPAEVVGMSGDLFPVLGAARLARWPDVDGWRQGPTLAEQIERHMREPGALVVVAFEAEEEHPNHVCLCGTCVTCVEREGES